MLLANSGSILLHVVNPSFSPRSCVDPEGSKSRTTVAEQKKRFNGEGVEPHTIVDAVVALSRAEILKDSANRCGKSHYSTPFSSASSSPEGSCSCDVRQLKSRIPSIKHSLRLVDVAMDQAPRNVGLCSHDAWWRWGKGLQ